MKLYKWTSWEIHSLFVFSLSPIAFRKTSGDLRLTNFEPKAFCCSDIGNRVKRDPLASFFWIPRSLFFPQKKEKAAVAKQTFYQVIQPGNFCVLRSNTQFFFFGPQEPFSFFEKEKGGCWTTGPREYNWSWTIIKEVIHPQVPLQIPCVDLPRLAEPRFELLCAGLIQTRLGWVDGQ